LSRNAIVMDMNQRYDGVEEEDKTEAIRKLKLAEVHGNRTRLDPT
jgi:hypothetical protein